MIVERWMLKTYEYGSVISRALFSTEEEAKRQKQKCMDEHVGSIRAYVIERQEIEL